MNLIVYLIFKKEQQGFRASNRKSRLFAEVSTYL